MLKLYLSGGGSKEDSYNLDQTFVSEVGSESILYIPHAAKIEKFPKYHEWLKSVFPDNEIILETNLSKIDKTLLSKFGGIYIGGGNTYRLKRILTESGFIDILNQYIEDGNPVYGGSAGAIILGRSIESCDSDKSELGEKTDASGLNLLHDYSIVCHFSGGEDEMRSFSKMRKVIFLSEKSGVKFDGLRLENFGEIGYKEKSF